jgi:hypothetical protein
VNRHHVTLFLERGESLAAQVRSSELGRLAWVGVYPLDLSSPLTAEHLRNEGIALLPTSPRPLCRVRFFEVDRDLVERDTWLSEEQLVNRRDFFAFGIEDLERILNSLGVSLEELERPFKSDYPI